jgi:hypothetical protein
VLNRLVCRRNRIFGTHTPRDEHVAANVIDLDRVRRRDVLGGVIREYRRAA